MLQRIKRYPWTAEE
jgi:hypothetical protein